MNDAAGIFLRRNFHGISIRLDGGKPARISIFTSAGRLVYSATSSLQELSIPFGKIGGTGVYFLKVNDQPIKSLGIW
jgi:hypothetical protein